MTELPSRPGRPTRILLLEDSDIDAELLVGHLDRAGLDFEIVRARDREGFVAALGQEELDIILSDYSLPQFDGLAALELAVAAQRDVPFIFVSGVLGEHFATESLKRGATDYVVKRNLARLPAAVQRALAEAEERQSRHRAESALQASELSMRLAVNAAHLGLWAYDPRTGLIQCDERCRELLGLGSGQALGYEDFIAGCHPDDRSRVDGLAHKAVMPGGAGEIAAEFRTLCPNGRMRWVATRGQAQFDGDTCTRVVGVLQDVSDQKAAESALLEINDALEARVEARTRERDRIWHVSHDLLGVADREGVFFSVNPAWQRVLGWTREELGRAPFFHLIHEEERSETERAFRSLGAERPSVAFENRVARRSGGWRWLSWTAVHDEGLIYCVGRDISSERMAVEELAATNRRLVDEIKGRERAEDTLRAMQRLEAVGQLTSGVAHDFNNLLTVVLGNLGFIERDLAAAEGGFKRRLTLMRLAAERGAKLTSQLLAFSRRQRLKPEVVDLNNTVLGMRDLLASTMGGSVRVEIELEPQLWSALVDPTQVELVILNLAINSRDAMDVGGTLRLATANVAGMDGLGDLVVIRVSDTGSGMSPDVLEKAFEPFFTTKEVGKGSGLGLAQVYGIVKQSGGEVTIETALGKGTTVSVMLPRAASTGERVARENGAAFEGADEDAGRVILIVDDDSEVREVTATMLRDEGFEVLEAGSGGAAIDLLERRPDIELMVVDYAMPGMNGAELTRHAQMRNPNVPFLFVTGYADLSVLQGLEKDGAIQKPFQRSDLIAGVRRALKRGVSRWSPPWPVGDDERESRQIRRPAP